MTDAVVLLSGGVDSAVALWWAKSKGWRIHVLTFDYYERPEKEKEATNVLARLAGAESFQNVDLPFMREVVDWKEIDISEDLSDAPPGYIPARNLIIYSIATYYGEILGADRIVGGHNKDDAEIFPDVGQDFLERLNDLTQRSIWTGEKKGIEIVFPFLSMTKTDVVRMGKELEVPFESTWSCFWNIDKPCGECDSCRDREAAFQEAGIS